MARNRQKWVLRLNQNSTTKSRLFCKLIYSLLLKWTSGTKTKSTKCGRIAETDLIKCLNCKLPSCSRINVIEKNRPWLVHCKRSLFYQSWFGPHDQFIVLLQAASCSLGFWSLSDFKLRFTIIGKRHYKAYFFAKQMFRNTTMTTGNLSSVWNSPVQRLQVS